jgi:hypothetical protein
MPLPAGKAAAFCACVAAAARPRLARMRAPPREPLAAHAVRDCSNSPAAHIPLDEGERPLQGPTCLTHRPRCCGPSLSAQGDACHLPASLGQFDAVLAANLLCRVPEPATALAQIKASLRPGAPRRPRSCQLAKPAADLVVKPCLVGGAAAEWRMGREEPHARSHHAHACALWPCDSLKRTCVWRGFQPAGGVALITSPFSWLEQYTDRSNWLGGRYKDGRPHR